MTVLEADGTQLPFGDGEFDVAFSNSVIEHVPPELQAKFASEVGRVADRYFVQTPNRYFPIEPHYQLPLFQFLPAQAADGAQQALLARLAGQGPLGGDHAALGARPEAALPGRGDPPRAKVLGLTKSLIAVRR